MNINHNRERIFLGIAILFSLLFIGLYIFDGRPSSEPATVNLTPIGIGEVVEQDVRRRIDGEINWTELLAKSRIFLRDTLFLGSKSKAVVKFNTGQVVSLTANTLVVLSVTEGQPEIEIKFGKLTAQISAKPIFIRTVEGNFEVSGDANLEAEFKGGNSLIVKSLKGVLSLKKGETGVTVEENKSYIISDVFRAEKIEAKPINCQFFEPSTTEINILKLVGGGVELKWLTQNELCSQFEVLVFRLDQPNVPIVRIPSQDQRIKFLPENSKSFLWQVRALNQEGQELARSLLQKVNQVTTSALLTPIPMSPSAQIPNPIGRTVPGLSTVLQAPELNKIEDLIFEKDFKGQKQKPISFTVAWSEVKGAGYYTIEYSAEPDFLDKKSAIVVATQAKIDVEIAQKYFVRVTAVENRTQRYSHPSEIKSFSYQLLEPLERPTDCSPKDNTIFSSTSETPMVLSWKESTAHYLIELEFARDRDFTKGKTVFEGNGHSFLLKEKNLAGVYFWRVRFFNKTTLQKSLWSEIHFFSIAKEPSNEAPH